MLRNKTFYDVVVETGTKRAENATIERKASILRESSKELFKHIRNKLPRLKSRMFADDSIEFSSTERELPAETPSIYARSFDKRSELKLNEHFK